MNLGGFIIKRKGDSSLINLEYCLTMNSLEVKISILAHNQFSH